MATIPRTYLTTSKDNILNETIPLKNGQVISVYDSDEVYYDVPADGTPTGDPVRRKISGIRVITEAELTEFLPIGTVVPMTGIAYIVIRPDSTSEIMPDGTPLYDIRVWIGDSSGEWYIVGTNRDDVDVRTIPSSERFYLSGSPSAAEVVGPLSKSTIYAIGNNIWADLKGNADTATNATHAATAESATKATTDKLDQDITGYVYDVSAATVNHATQFTFTFGSSTTKAPTVISALNTEYDVFSATTAGLVDKTNGIDPTDPTIVDTSGLVLSGSGWVPSANLSIGTATKAINDKLSHDITTYIRNASGMNNSTGTLLTFTLGDGVTTIPVQTTDTKYSVFNTTTNGLVPMALGTGTTAKFLRGDSTWQAIPVYSGATASAAGTAGLVPAANSGDTAKYLRSDGTWQGNFGVGVAGLAPGTTNADSNKFLKGDGTWADDTKNTAGATNDTNKLFVIGAQAQSASPQTYSNVKVYIQNDKLYSNAEEVVSVSATQNLTNKTYNGYTLAESCSRPVANTLDEIAEDNFTGDGSETEFGPLAVTAASIDYVYINDVLQSESTYSLNTTDNTVVFTSAPANDATIKIIYYNAEYDSNALASTGSIISYLPDAVSGLLGNSGFIAADVIAPIYDSNLTYTVGSYCTHQLDGTTSYKLYRCTTAVTSPEDFNPAKWTVSTVAEMVSNS